MSTPTQVVTSPAASHSPLIDFFERVPVIAGGTVAIIGALILLALLWLVILYRMIFSRA